MTTQWKIVYISQDQAVDILENHPLRESLHNTRNIVPFIPNGFAFAYNEFMVCVMNTHNYGCEVLDLKNLNGIQVIETLDSRASVDQSQDAFGNKTAN
jgi:hypothetical protein